MSSRAGPSAGAALKKAEASFAESLAETRRTSRDPALRRLLLGGDALAVLLTLGLVVAVAPAARPHHHFLWFLAAVPLMAVIFKVYGLYDRDMKRISHSTVDDLPWLFHAAVIGGLLFWVYSRWSPMGRLDFVQILVFGLGLIVLVLAVRWIVRSVASALIGHDRALLVGGGELASAFIRKLAAHPEYRVQVIGTLIAEHTGAPAESGGLPVLGHADSDPVGRRAPPRIACCLLASRHGRA